MYGIRKRPFSTARPLTAPITLMPINCAASSKWSKITLEGSSRSPTGDSPFEAQSMDQEKVFENVYRAERPERMPLKALKFEPTCTSSFKDSDGVHLLNNNLVVEHHFAKENRQAVVSNDWVHSAHTVKKRTWMVRANQAQYAYGDIFFGLTEAQAWCFEGRSVGFDVRGNFWVGARSPRDLTNKYRAHQLQSVTGASSTGDSSACGRSSNIHVTAELPTDGKGKMTVQVYDEGESVEGEPTAEFVFPLEEWGSARLLVSFSSRRGGPSHHSSVLIQVCTLVKQWP